MALPHWPRRINGLEAIYSFWKTILGTVLGAVSVVGAHTTANWLANHNYRAKPAPPMLAEVLRAAYVPARSYVKVPNYFQHHTMSYPVLRSHSRH